MPYNRPIIVFSHLRWDFVYQRPQHLLSRLAANRQVIFIEEPLYDEEAPPYWEQSTPTHNVLVCQPHLPMKGYAFSDEQTPPLYALLQELVESQELTDYIVWMYTPMALPLAKTLRPLTVIYDCMDELSAFRFAPPQLLQREAQLLECADLVFTGGPSLYRAKAGRHPRVYCFPSSVDADHFAQARWVADADDQKPIPIPRLGFYGVIDERLDIPLIDALSAARPDWQIVMVGPVVKIEESDLPRRPNIHYMGPRQYEQLPSYLAGWHVCLLPFALNESTRFISPTKTLEYMAAELPIVSTPITDVVEPYGDIVFAGETPEEFIAACERALSASPEEMKARTHKARQVLASTSWNSTVRAMETLIEKVIATRAGTEERRSIEVT